MVEPKECSTVPDTEVSRARNPATGATRQEMARSRRFREGDGSGQSRPNSATATSKS
jgi:hypothetical protein